MLVEAFEYKQWADERTLDAVNRVDRVARAESFAFVLQQINHIVIVEELFRSRLLRESPPHKSTNTDQVPDFEELSHRIRRSNQWYAEFVASTDRRDECIRFLFADGRRGAMSVEEILFHVLTHSSYHRGNIAHALDLAGVPHPADGYGIFIHEREPQRRQTA